MSESIYACLFSSGLIKVGMSINPVDRMASHASRVSCAGITVVDTHHAECLGSASVAEKILIEKCRKLAGERFKSEWFFGLDFGEVVSWINEISSKANDAIDGNFGMWKSIITDLLATGLSQTEIGTLSGVSQSQISQLYCEAIKNPSWPIGEALRILHAERCPEKAAA